MNKTVIKQFAIEARRDLITSVTAQAALYGITAEGNTPEEKGGTDFVVIKNKLGQEMILDKAQKSKRDALINRISETGFEATMEEVAYTWFNRLIAIRFMEINDYLPSKNRVLSSETPNKWEPDIITEAPDIELNLTETEKNAIYSLKQENKMDELFRMLFIKQCNELHKLLPEMFKETTDYMELLFNLSYLNANGVVRHLLDIPEDDFKNAVEIIGWMYQYYNTEPKVKVDKKVKGKGKVNKEEIGAKTELFTPDWIVRYMVENSLGRLWLEGHPNDRLKSEMKYYLDEAKQDEKVQKQLDEIKEEHKKIKPEEIKIIDPCMGSGHILVYAFDVLIKIYESCGYTSRDAVKSIVENNLYGIDIDDRAYQLAYFAVMMKAVQYGRIRILKENLKTNLCPIKESNSISEQLIKNFANGDKNLFADVTKLIKVFKDAREYGSIINPESLNIKALEDRLNELKNDKTANMFVEAEQKRMITLIEPLMKQIKLLSNNYDVVVTNPPYMRSSNMDVKLYEYVKENYPDSKSDMFAVFIERCGHMVKEHGYQAMITMHSWMFLSSYEKLRKKLLRYNIVNMAHLGSRAFEEIGGEVVQTTSFILRIAHLDNYLGKYCRLTGYANQQEKMKMYLAGGNQYVINEKEFACIPGNLFAYWLSKAVLGIFENTKKLADYGETKKGLSTSDNDRFVRMWSEVSLNKINFKTISSDDTYNNQHKWYPYVHGGNSQKWYPFFDTVVNFRNGAEDIKNTVMKKYSYLKSPDFVVKKIEIYFKEGIIWNDMSSVFNAKWLPAGNVFSDVTPMYITGCDMKGMLGFFNSKVFELLASVICQGMHFSTGHIPEIPYKKLKTEEEKIVDKQVQECIDIAKKMQSYEETSWCFEMNALIDKEIKDLSNAFLRWKNITDENFKILKKSEEQINEIFINSYGLQDELVPEIEEGKITVYRASLESDVKKLLSYAVGCLFGRYSVDVKGTIYAGGTWDNNAYKTIIPDSDNIIPITDEEYFADDIVTCFIDFIKRIYGEEKLNFNLQFIAKALGGSGTAREVIRNYFLKDFYKDHVKIYQKRPIYWLFDSGKENGFKALIYMHRYDEDTVGRVRADYLHKMQAKLESEINRCDTESSSTTNAAEKGKLIKRRAKLVKQLAETRVYDEALAHIAVQRIALDLDDGVKVNYAKFQDIEVVDDGGKKTKVNLLAKI